MIGDQNEAMETGGVVVTLEFERAGRGSISNREGEERMCILGT